MNVLRMYSKQMEMVINLYSKKFEQQNNCSLLYLQLYQIYFISRMLNQTMIMLYDHNDNDTNINIKIGKDMHNTQNITDLSQKNSIQIITSQLEQPIRRKLDNVHKTTIPKLQPSELYVDHDFKLQLPDHKFSTRKMQLKRLSDLYPVNSSLFVDLKSGRPLETISTDTPAHKPTYISQLSMLPLHHWSSLIQPSYINPYGYYYITVCKQGSLYKQIIDDIFYYDVADATIRGEDGLNSYAWIYILVKAWAKLNKGYDKLKQCKPFQFLRTFTYPDWDIVNVNKQSKQYLVSKLSKAATQQYLIVAQTKNNSNVGLYGFMPNCASYVIKSHYQEYGNIFIILKLYTYGNWNKHASSPQTPIPQIQQIIGPNQCMIPLQQFKNIFNFLHITPNKYNPSRTPKQISYTKQNIIIDSLQTNSHTLQFEVCPQPQHVYGQVFDRTQAYTVSLCLYMRDVRIFDLVKNYHMRKELEGSVIPHCKVMIGKIQEMLVGDEKYMESMKQSILSLCQADSLNFACYKNVHDYVYANYFKGYTKTPTYILSLKPGKYLLRLKLQQLRSQYSIQITSTSIDSCIKFSDAKLSQRQQILFLQDCLFKKAVHERKNLTFVNPAKRGSWISFRDQYENVGYSYVAVHVIKNADNKLEISIRPKLLKDAGYLVKGIKDMDDYKITVDSQENTVIVFKYDRQWAGQGKRIWPPPGIQFTKIPRIKKPVSLDSVQGKI